LESGSATFLFVYGNLFYAAASTLEKNLPDVKGTSRAVVILLLRGNEDVGSTVNEVFRRYAEALQSHSGKLILAGVSPTLRNQLERTGLINLIGSENIFPATDALGEAGNAALQAATDWLAQSSPEQDVADQLKETKE
jgi:SulP family sulfate permease